MIVKNHSELTNTRKKLRLLEKMYEDARTDIAGDVEVRETELESLQRLINQLKEEIVRYEVQHLAGNQ